MLRNHGKMVVSSIRREIIKGFPFHVLKSWVAYYQIFWTKRTIDCIEASWWFCVYVELFVKKMITLLSFPFCNNCQSKINNKLNYLFHLHRIEHTVILSPVNPKDVSIATEMTIFVRKKHNGTIAAMILFKQPKITHVWYCPFQLYI